VKCIRMVEAAPLVSILRLVSPHSPALCRCYDPDIVSFLLTHPSAGAVVVGRQHAMGYNMRTFSPIFHDAGFGSGERPCLKAAPLVAPGPGAYNLSGTGVYGEPPHWPLTKAGWGTHLHRDFSTL
jgi:hypothetical protein